MKHVWIFLEKNYVCQINLNWLTKLLSKIVVISYNKIFQDFFEGIFIFGVYKKKIFELAREKS